MFKKKRIIMIHGWGGNPRENFLPWLEEELKKKGFETQFLEMPNSEEPVITGWLDFMKKKIKKLDGDTYFIGHSIGCQAIMRYLAGLEEGVKIGGVLFVAGWFDLIPETYENEEDMRIAKPWIETPISFDEIKKHCDIFTALFSDNDPFVSLDESKLFEETLDAKIIILKNKGHFDDEEYPEILNAILKMV